MDHPTQLGKYPITGVLGQGAMGVVYKGFDPVIQRLVAIKTIQKSLLGEGDEAADMAKRFRNEAQAVGRLSHPGIVQIYEYGEDDATAFIAMEFVEGRTLDRLLQEQPRLAESEVLSVMDQLLEALDAAHRVGVWHRDIKPANVLLTHEGQVKLTDFGIARIEHVALTQVASMIGTPGYMAPEQYVGEGLSHKVDLFAAGVVLYRLLTGSAPFTGGQQQVMYKILHEDPLPPSRTTAACASFYDDIVARALAKQPEQRFANAAAFRQALARRGMPMTTVRRVVDQDATVLAPSRGTGSGGSGAASWITGADAAAEVAEMERALATVMGPVARAIVKQAARTCSDVDSLRRAVAQQIPDERDRALFVSGSQAKASTAGTGGVRTLFSGSRAPAPQPTAPAPAPAADDPLTEPTVAAAAQLVAEVMGPIAKLLVKKAAAQATTRSQFVQTLLAAAEPGDRPRLAAVLSRLPD